MADLSDKKLGEFRLMRHLGSGGMADVYLAEQTTLQRYVAVKVMKPNLMAHSGSDMVARFKQEAMMAAGLNHPNIVQVYTIGQEGDLHFIAQEYVQGKDLASIIKDRGKPDVSSALHVLRQVAAALKASGLAGIVHRDIKPENILITKKGEVKVADFGLAQLGESNVERKSVTMGTPLYMSPEQVSGRELDPRSDVYSFGVTAYQLLCGETPFKGNSAIAIAKQHLTTAPPPLKEKNPALPDILCRMVHRMMAKRRTLRYQSADEVLEDLKKLVTAQKQGRSLDLVRLPRLEELERLSEQERAKNLSQPSSSSNAQDDADDYGIELPFGATAGKTVAIPVPSRRKPQSEAEGDERRDAAARKLKAGASSHKSADDADEGSFTKPGFKINPEELIDMTAMVDIVFFLLIYFLVTSMDGVQSAIPMPAPNAQEGVGASTSVAEPNSLEQFEENEDYIVVNIDHDDRIEIDGNQLQDIPELVNKLRELHSAPPNPSKMLVVGHGDATHGTMVAVLDAGQDAGIEMVRISIDNQGDE